jgi:hypothetical protein
MGSATAARNAPSAFGLSVALPLRVAMFGRSRNRQGQASMIPALQKILAIVALGLLAAAAKAQTQNPARQDGAAASVTVISPIFGQLVRLSMPSNFIAASEKTKDAFYIRESVLKGETVEAWTQMITVTGSRGLAAVADFSPQKLATFIAQGFRKYCPESFALKDLGETKLGGQEAHMTLAGCGKVNSAADGHSETALIVAVRGATDAYTVQWAERRPQASPGPDLDDPIWRERLGRLMPIRLCAILPGEAAPYPSCLQHP